VLSKISSQNVF